MKINLLVSPSSKLRLLLVSGLLCLANTLSAQLYFFQQTGFTGGGVINGSFTGTDLNANGQFSSFSGEVSLFSVSFTGNSIITNFSSSVLSGLVYDIDSPFIGDGPTLATEGLASNWPSTVGFEYKSGLGPNGAFGGVVTDHSTGLFTSTSELIRVSRNPFGAVPEPSTYGLIGAVFLIGAAVMRRRRALT